MPYIPGLKREKFVGLLNAMNLSTIENPGELNFLITSLVHSYLNSLDYSNYQAYNDALGALECAKLELYRRYVAPYEDLKIEENGDV